MKDPRVRSKLDRLRLTASRPEEVERAERMIDHFETATGDDTPPEVLAFLSELGVYIDEDAHRRPDEERRADEIKSVGG